MHTKEQHWQEVYANKESNQVSWYKDLPKISLDFITGNAPKNAKVIDVGGGDSNLVDFLLDQGLIDITVLDISATALEKAQKRLGERAALVKWIVTDILDFRPEGHYDLWHDRAAFHFLTDSNDIARYETIMASALKDTGVAFLGTFSEQGPEKCSGIPISRYSEQGLSSVFQVHFEKLDCFTNEHHTPMGTVQDFRFCSFRKRTE